MGAKEPEGRREARNEAPKKSEREYNGGTQRTEGKRMGSPGYPVSREQAAPVRGPSLCDGIYACRGEGEPLGDLREAIAAGADLDERCAHVGRTPLMLCAQKGWTGCVAVLLGAGANPLLRDELGRDALMLSLIARKVECARVLAPRSDLRARDVDGRAALALAMIHAPHKVDARLLAMLWKPGVDRWRDINGMHACDWAIAKEVAALPEWLCFKRAAIEARALGKAASACLEKKSAALRM